MPRNVKNAWVQVFVDGEEKYAGGTKDAKGQMEVAVNYRDNGNVSQVPIRISVWPDSNDDLNIEVYGPGGMTQERPHMERLNFTMTVKR